MKNSYKTMTKSVTKNIYLKLMLSIPRSYQNYAVIGKFTFDEDFMQDYSKVSDKGYILEVDFKNPKEL